MKTKPKSKEQVSNAQVTRMLNPRVWRATIIVLIAATATLMASVLTQTSIGSGTIFFVTIVALLFMWLLLRVLSSKGKFRFASLLFLMVFTAIPMSLFIPPMKARAKQKAAIAQVQSRGGKVEIFPMESIESFFGWGRTRSGLMVPAVLLDWYMKNLMPDSVGSLTLPSSLLEKGTLDDLNCVGNGSLTILLDGKSVSAAPLNALLRSNFNYVVENPIHWGPPVTFQAQRFGAAELQFLEGLDLANLVIEVLPETQPNFEALSSLNKRISFQFTSMPKNPKVFEQMVAIQNLDSVVVFQTSIDPELIAAIEQRSRPIDSLKLIQCRTNQPVLDSICSAKQIRKLVVSDLMLLNFANFDDFQGLRSNPRIEELAFYIRSSGNSTIGSILSPQGLKVLRAYGIESIDDQTLTAIENSDLEIVEIATPDPIPSKVEPRPWMNRMKSFRVDGRQLNQTSNEPLR